MMNKNDSSSEDSRSGNDERKAKSIYDVQRKQLEKLMSHPEREVEIPAARKDDEQKPRAFQPHEYVRNVMGASAGAGSGEFDIYRGCRRREGIRQEYLQEQAEKQRVRREFEERRQAHLAEAEKKTAKRRAKRLKQKEKLKKKKLTQNEDSQSQEERKSATDDDYNQVIDLDEKEEEIAEKQTQ